MVGQSRARPVGVPTPICMQREDVIAVDIYNGRTLTLAGALIYCAAPILSTVSLGANFHFAFYVKVSIFDTVESRGGLFVNMRNGLYLLHAEFWKDRMEHEVCRVGRMGVN